MTEGGLQRVRLFIILKHQGVRHRFCGLDGPGELIARKPRRIVEFQDELRLVRQEVAEAAFPIGLAVLDVDDVHQQPDRILQRGTVSGQTLSAAHPVDLCLDIRGIVVVQEVELGQEDAVHVVILHMPLHRHDGHRKQSGRKIMCGRQGALQTVCIKTDRAVQRDIVLGEQALFFQPQAEVLAHGGLQHGPAQGQLSGVRGPLKPVVRGDLIEERAFSRQRRTDIVPAEDDDLLQLIVCRILRRRGGAAAFADAAFAAALGEAGSAQRGQQRHAQQQCQDFLTHGFFPPIFFVLLSSQEPEKPAPVQMSRGR